MRKHRFFYHYRKQTKTMSVHYRGKCYISKDIECNVPTETKWNKIQPNLVIRGWCSRVTITKDKIIIN